jgi:hypothetical protein
VTWLREQIAEGAEGITLSPDNDITAMDAIIGVVSVQEGHLPMLEYKIDEVVWSVADLSVPLIVVRIECRGEFISAWPVDGWDRITRARHEGIGTLPAYLVSAELSNKALVAGCAATLL